MKFVIVGRSASGKDRLAKAMSAYGMTVLRTYTTRPCRNETDAQSHVFINGKVAEKYDDKCLAADFGGAAYFARKPDVEAADILILEPAGCVEACNLFPDEVFYVLNVVPEDMDAADEKYMARFSKEHAEDEIAAERERLARRRKQEDELFGPFERALSVRNSDEIPSNVGRTYTLVNRYDAEEMEQTAKAFASMKRQFDNMLVFACQMSAIGIFETEAVTNRPILAFTDEAGKTVNKTVGIEALTMTLLNNDALFTDAMRQYVACEFKEFPVPNEVKYQAYRMLHGDDDAD